MGGNGAMILGAIFSFRNLVIKVIEGKYNSLKYLDDLQTPFIPWCHGQFGQNKWIWQQENASTHTEKKVL